MNLRDAYRVLGLEPGVDMSTVKRAYRRLAFSLHPDLNPDVPDASRRFQEINEAYVHLSEAALASKARREASFQDAADSAKAREEASKAYNKAKQGQKEATAGARRPKEDVLKDILNDPFARRVFEDIYSHIRKDAPGAKEAPKGASAKGRTKAKPPTGTAAKAIPLPGSDMLGKVKGWLRKQVDDEQVVRLPGASLVPGARVRLEIQHGFGGEPQVVELTLPPEFVPGKAMRLKGMGRRLGSLRGDLYVRIEAL